MLRVVVFIALLTPGLDPEAEVEAKCCGRYAISLVAGFLDECEPGHRWEFRLPSEEAPFSLSQLEAAAREAGFDAVSVHWPDPSVADLSTPCVLHVRSAGGSGHFIACFGSLGDNVLVGDYPAWPRLMPRVALLRIWSGDTLYLGRPGSGDLSRLRWQARKAYVRPALWAALGGALAALAWLTWRQKHARHPATIPPATEVTSP